jgi:hypothetical protein
MKKNIDLGLAFNDLITHTYRRHMGVLLERHNGGYRMYENKSNWFHSWDAACTEIDRRQTEMMELVKKQNKQI